MLLLGIGDTSTDSNFFEPKIQPLGIQMEDRDQDLKRSRKAIGHFHFSAY